MSGAPISWAQYCQVTPGVTWQYCAQLIGPRLIGARHLLDSIGSLRAAEERGHPRGDKHRTSCHGETVAASPEEVGSHACL